MGRVIESAEAVRRADEPHRLEIAIASVRGAAVTSYGAVFGTYAALVLVLWLPFGPRNGMPYETGFPWMSETRGWFEGFFFPGDDLRPYTSVFYHLAYLLGELTGVAGSFVPYQLVYAFLWWGRGVLVFLIIAGLTSRRSVVAYLAGALTIAHASDHALNWVGQMNQFGMMFWLLLSLFLLVRGLLSTHPIRAALWCIGALLAARACLWSYESPLVIMLLIPALIVLVERHFRTRGKLALVAAYYTVPLYYGALNLQRYLSGSSTYQQSVTRDDISLGQLLSDLAFNVRTSVSFWNWADPLPPVSEAAYLLGAGAFVVVVGGGLVAYWLGASEAPRRGGLIALAVSGGLVLVASFPAYLILTSSRLIWRTQFLSGIGFGALMAALIVLAATLPRGRLAQLAVAFTASAVIAFFGGAASYRAADFHYGIWLRHKHAIQEVLEAAPRVRPKTVIVYTGVPSSADPFGDAMWFDLALRLAYPNVPVAGVYYRERGRAAPGQGLKLQGGRWELTGTGFPPLFHSVPLSHTVFIEYSTGEARTLDRVPSFLVRQASSTDYKPASVVAGPVPDERALRRYGPIDGSESHDS